MLEAGGGGGGGTDWWGMDMETIHGLAQSPDVDAQYQIVDGWQKSIELIGNHMSQVQDYRNALAAAWPPEKSKAAQAYLTRLDSLLKQLNETYEAALSNHEALTSASLSLSLARTDVAKIYDEWAANKNTLLAFNQQQAQRQQQAQAGRPVPTPGPSGEEPPPVTASQQEALRQRAVAVMSSVSSDLAQAQLKVVRPQPYESPIMLEKNAHVTDTGGGVPTVPPIVPAPYSGSGGGVSRGGSRLPAHGSASTFPTSAEVTPPTIGSSLPHGGGSPGLVLGGVTPPSTLPGPSTGLNPITNVPGSSPVTHPGAFPPGPGPGLFVPKGTPPPTTIGSVPPNEGSFKPAVGLPERGLRAMPPGGVIGKTPVGGLNESEGGRFGPQRINPVGGVIGEPGVGGAGARGVGGFDAEGMSRGSVPGSRGGSIGPGAQARISGAPSEQPYGQIGGRRAGRPKARGATHWDPDNPWVTDEGVDPVVLPPGEQPINPGPAIGLS